MDRLGAGCLGIIVVLGIVIFMIVQGISAGTRAVASGAGHLYSSVIDGDDARPDTLVFAGRISRDNDTRWLNNRLVLGFAQDQEVGRVLSSVASYRQRVLSPTDGVFQLTLRNLYAVNAKDLTVCQSVEFAQKTLYCWLGEMREDAGGFQFRVPEKRLDLAVRVIPGDYEALPEEMKETGATALLDGNIVLAPPAPEHKGLLGRIADRFSQMSGAADALSIRKVFYKPNDEIVQLPDQSQTVNLNNCFGNEVSRQVLVDSKTIVQEIEVDAGVSVGIPIEMLTARLGMHGNYRYKKITSRTARQEVAARAGTHVVYKIRWEEVWSRGTAVIRSPLGVQNVPFRLRKDVQYLIKSFSQKC